MIDVRLSARVGAAVLLSTSLLAAMPAAEAHSSQFGCTFHIPPPSFTDGRVQVDIETSCVAAPRLRRLEFALVADDAVYDDIIKARVVSLGQTKAADVVIGGPSLDCAEDALWTDEVYVRARVETYADGAWRAGSWKRGRTARHHCS